MRLWIAFLSLLALAACADASGSRDFSFTGVAPSPAAGNDESTCPEAAFPGGASLDGQHDSGMTFFCEH